MMSTNYPSQEMMLILMYVVDLYGRRTKRSEEAALDAAAINGRDNESELCMTEGAEQYAEWMMPMLEHAKIKKRHRAAVEVYHAAHGVPEPSLPF